jgi:hypothetical protein
LVHRVDLWLFSIVNGQHLRVIWGRKFSIFTEFSQLENKKSIHTWNEQHFQKSISIYFYSLVGMATQRDCPDRSKGALL